MLHSNLSYTRALALALTALLSVPTAQASTYSYRQASVGIKPQVAPSVAPTIGPFVVPSKTSGSGVFTLTDPTSNSSGSFSYVSSNPAVATISGSTVTVTGVGSSTITATQAASPGYLAAATTASLIVTLPGYLASGGLTWRVPSATLQYWAAANAYCTTGAFAGWRLPTEAEGAALGISMGASNLASQGWPVTGNGSYTWTSTGTPAICADCYKVFSPDGTISTGFQGSTNKVSASCVH